MTSALVAHLVGLASSVRSTSFSTDSVDTSLALSFTLSITATDPQTGSISAHFIWQTVRFSLASTGAEASNAHLPSWTPGGGRAGGSSWLAPVNGISFQTARAGAECLVVLGPADGVDAAVADGAGIDALVLLTSQLLGAINMRPASLDASHSPAELSRATVRILATDLLTEIGDAELSRRAIGVGAADSLAESRVALSVLRTLLVAGALDGLAHAADDGGGVGGESGFAGASGALVEGLADGAWAAGDASAGILAAVVDAGQGRGAVSVLAAANQTHLVKADMAKEAIIVHTTSNC